MPYIHFTEDQKRRASEADLVEFLQHQGEKLVRSGPEYRLTSDHSVTVRGNEWFDHATERGGGPVSFLKEFYGMNYQQAVLTLLDQDIGQLCPYVDSEGKCWPGIRTIAAELGISRSTVKRALNDLCKAELISKEHRWRENGSLSSNLYRLL